MLAAGAAAGCTAGGATQPGSTEGGISRTLGAPGKGGPSAAAPVAVWPTFGRDTARTGGTPRLHRPGRLSVAWRARLDHFGDYVDDGGR